MIEDMLYLSDVSELRPLYRDPSSMVIEKQIDWIDPHCRDFIARSLLAQGHSQLATASRLPPLLFPAPMPRRAEA